MEATQVDSSHIKAIGYEPETKTLEITFVKGGTYHFKDVPPHVYGQLMNADSTGKHFAKNIKHNYQAKKQ